MMYEHTQRAPIHWLLHVLGAYCLFAAWTTQEISVIPFVLMSAGALFFLLGVMFMHLTIRDEGECLSVRFGPLPVFGTRIRYDDITSVEQSRSAIIDGWGIHYIPGRGATYNLWGFDCAKLLVKGRIVRIGSNDVGGLTAFLQAKIGKEKSAENAS